jgi:hypothetical protein
MYAFFETNSGHIQKEYSPENGYTQQQIEEKYSKSNESCRIARDKAEYEAIISEE